MRLVSAAEEETLEAEHEEEIFPEGSQKGQLGHYACGPISHLVLG
jgi:hypothetical protein